MSSLNSRNSINQPGAKKHAPGSFNELWFMLSTTWLKDPDAFFPAKFCTGLFYRIS